MKGTRMAKTEKAKPGPTKRKPAAKTSRKIVPAKARKAEREANGIDSLAKILEHPIIAELISIGAIAAVAAIADHNVKTRTGEGQKGSTKALKAAGSAAAAAMGKRLLSEMEEIRKASKKPG